MISNKYSFHLFSFIMSLIMSGVISLAMLAFKSDSYGQFILNWPIAWITSMLVAFPASYVVVPTARRLVSLLVIKD